MGRAKSHWSYSTGERGRNRVRAFEHSSGVLMLEFNERRRGKAARVRLSLGHRDQARAKQQADDAAAKLGKPGALKPEELTLRELFDIYGDEVTPGKAARTQKKEHTTAQLFLRFFGPNFQPKNLSNREWNRFKKERASGRLRPSGSRRIGVGPRTVARDLEWLQSVLRWATRAGDGKGGVLLERNPLEGLPVPREKSPRRPTVSPERYDALLAVADDVDWRFKLALVLAHETGHRIGAVRRLRWKDVDIEQQTICWPKLNRPGIAGDSTS